MPDHTPCGSRPANRFGVALATIALAAGIAAGVSGCGSNSASVASSTTPEPTLTQLTASADPSTTEASSRDCPVAQPPVPSSVDGLVTPIPGLTVLTVCASDLDPGLARLEKQEQFAAVTAATFDQNGAPVLNVIAGQLKSLAGDEYVGTFLADLSSAGAQSTPPRTVATEPAKIGGYDVTHFNVALDIEGYTYADGPMVVIAYLQSGEVADGKDAFAQILANLQ